MIHIRHRAPGHQWSVSRALAGLLVCHSAHEWLLVCWLLVASLPFIQFKGTAGGLPEIPCVTGFAHVIRPFFLTPFLEPKSPTCVKMVPQSDPKMIQNLAFCRHGEPHSDMVFTDREPHWPIQGRFQNQQKNRSSNLSDPRTR